MPPREDSRCLASASRWLPALILCLTLLLSPFSSRGSNCSICGSSGSRLRSSSRRRSLPSSVAVRRHRKRNGAVEPSCQDAATTDVIEQFFSKAGPSAYEIGAGKLLKRGRYEFPVVPISGASKATRTRCRFSSVVVVNTGNNDWAVDKLP